MDSFNRVVYNMFTRYPQRVGDGVVTVAATAAGVYDPATSEYVPATPTDWPVKVMVFDFTLQSNGAQTQPGTLIQVGDKQVYVMPPDGMPRLRPESDYLTILGHRFKIVTYKELNPSGTNNALIELFVRS